MPDEAIERPFRITSADPPHQRPWPTHLSGATILVATAWLTFRSHQAPGLSDLFIALAFMWAGLLYAFLIGSRSAPLSLRELWFWAILFRLAGLFAEPVLEDDWHRYLWDGRTFATEGNPYKHSPDFYFANPDVPGPFQRILDNVNHPDVPTVYGPVCQYVFLGAHLVAPGKLWAIKLALLGADSLIIFCLLKLTTPRNTLLYAWSPLVIHEVALNAHPEILGVSAAVLALYAARQNKSATSLIALGVSLASRIQAVLAAPFILLLTPVRRWWIMLAIIALCYAPFLAQGSLADWNGLRAFLQHWEFNSTIYALAALLGGAGFAKALCGAVFVAFFAFIAGKFWRRSDRSDSAPRLDIVYGAFFLLSAVVNPWYLLWIAPFVALRPSVTGLMACAIVSLSYAHGLNMETAGLAPYEHPWWVRLAEVGSILIALVVDRLLVAKRKAE